MARLRGYPLLPRGRSTSLLIHLVGLSKRLVHLCASAAGIGQTPFDEAACRRFLCDGLEALCAEKGLARRWLSLIRASVHVALAGLFLMQRVESEADGSHNTKTKRAVRYRHR